MSNYQDMEAFSDFGADSMDETRKKKAMQDDEQKTVPIKPDKDPDPDEEDADPLTDKSGEEKKEHYINTDERRKDLHRKKP